MPVTVHAELTHTFPVQLFAQRDPDNQERWVIFCAKVGGDGGGLHYPDDAVEDDPVEIGDLSADYSDRAIGIHPDSDWDDITPAQRVSLIELWNESES